MGREHVAAAARVERRLEDSHLPQFSEGVQSARAIATAGGLGDGFERRHRPVHDREIEIDSCLDALGGNQPARLWRVGVQARTHVVEHIATVRGAQVGGQVEQAIGAFHRLQQVVRVALQVDDAQRLRRVLVHKAIGERRPVDGFVGIRPMRLHARQTEEHASVLWDDLHRPPTADGVFCHLIVQGLECWLGGGGEYDTGVVGRAQVRQRRQRGNCQPLRQALRLVEQNHRVTQMVQLAACRGPIREQRFQQLHIRREDDRRVPIFGQQAALALGVVVGAAFGIGQRVFATQSGEAVVFENVVVRFRRKHLRILTSGLLDDAEVGHREHNP